MPFDSPNAPASAANKSSLMDYRVQQLEKQLDTVAQDQKSWAQHTETQNSQTIYDQTALYTNHLNTVSIILGLTSFFLVVGGSVVGWLGFNNLKKLIKTLIDEKAATHLAKLEELSAQHEEVLKSLEKQNKQYQEVLDRQDRQDKQIKSLELLQQGNKAYSEKNYKLASDLYSQSIELLKSPEAHYNRGLARGEMNQFELAIADYNEVIRLGSGDAGTHITRDYGALINMGIAKLKSGQYETALVDFDIARRLNPNDDGSYFNRACGLALMKKPAIEVLPDLKRAIELDKKNVESAKNDKDFDSIKNDPAFRALVGLEPLK